MKNHYEIDFTKTRSSDDQPATLTANEARNLMQQPPTLEELVASNLIDIEAKIIRAARSGKNSTVALIMEDLVMAQVSNVLKERGFSVSTTNQFLTINW